MGVIYHSWYPGPNDPFYLHNSGDNAGRIGDYGISNVPELRLDGSLEPIYFYTYDRIRMAYEQRLSTPTSVEMELAGSRNSGSGLVNVTATARASSPLPSGDYRLHLVLTESGIIHAAPNGIDVHDHTMRAMAPDFTGTPASFGGAFPQSAQAEAQFSLDVGYDADHCRVVAFLQDGTTREVIQATAIPVTELPDVTPTKTSSWSAIKGSFPAR